MKFDIFNHIFPGKYFDKMLELLFNGANMHKGSAMFQLS
jgi:hypothetical protein